MRTTPRLAEMRWRLLAAFVTVAVGAVALLAVTAVVAVDRLVAELAREQRAQLRAQVAAALADAYLAGRGSWTSSGLASVRALADAHDLSIVVSDPTGQAAARYTPGHSTWDVEHSSPQPDGQGDSGTEHVTPRATSQPAVPAPGQPEPSPGGEPQHTSDHNTDHSTDHSGEHSGGNVGAPSAPPAQVTLAAQRLLPVSVSTSQTVTVPIVVNGQDVGSARLTLPAGMDPSVATLRQSMLTTLAAGAALAVALAVLAAAFVARRLSRPVVALTAATRAFADGDPRAGELVRAGPGELGELAEAFTTMASTIRRQDEVRRAVVADVAHELRTPVTILRGQTEAILDGVSEPTPERLVSLHDEVLRLERLTDDLATLSAADAAALSLHRAPVDLAELARRSLDALAPVLDDAGLSARLDVGHAVVVAGDDTRLVQVVTNLVNNAAKFTPPGGSVTLTVARVDDEAVLTVADTGPGISADDLPHLFERFWRGSAARVHRGTGIGLSVVRALVLAHGGTVTADSPPGWGARFTVRLPALDEAA